MTSWALVSLWNSWRTGVRPRIARCSPPIHCWQDLILQLPGFGKIPAGRRKVPGAPRPLRPDHVVRELIGPAFPFWGLLGFRLEDPLPQQCDQFLCQTLVA